MSGLKSKLHKTDALPHTMLAEIFLKYIELNKAEPFIGNGKSTRIYLDMMHQEKQKKCVDWSKLIKENYMNTDISNSTIN